MQKILIWNFEIEQSARRLQQSTWSWGVLERMFPKTFAKLNKEWQPKISELTNERWLSYFSRNGRLYLLVLINVLMIVFLRSGKEPSIPSTTANCTLNSPLNSSQSESPLSAIGAVGRRFGYREPSSLLVIFGSSQFNN